MIKNKQNFCILLCILQISSPMLQGLNFHRFHSIFRVLTYNMVHFSFLYFMLALIVINVRVVACL